MNLRYTYDVERRQTMGRTVKWYAVEYQDGMELFRQRCRSKREASETIERWRKARERMSER